MGYIFLTCNPDIASTHPKNTKHCIAIHSQLLSEVVAASYVSTIEFIICRFGHGKFSKMNFLAK